jgi:glycosyltransferase involved in cell wall biosynthesis
MKKKIFLLIVPFIDDGGVEKSVANIANYIQVQNVNSGYAVHVFALRKGNELGRKFFHNERNLFLNPFSLLQLCFKERKNLILFSALTPANILGAILSLIFGIRYFPSQQCVVYNRNPFKWFFLKIIYKAIYRQSTRFIAISEGIRENLISIIGRDEKIVKWYNPVIETLISPVVQKKLYPQQQLIKFCVLGRLSKQKGFDILIKALHEVVRMGNDNFHLTIAGNGDEEQTLKQMVSDFQLEDKIEFQGFVFEHLQFYKDKDYYLFPSRYEGLGLALIEAMNYGLPVIAANCEHGPAEILMNGKYGVLINDIENVQIWANTIKELLNEEVIDIHLDYTESLTRFLTPAYIAQLGKDPL